MDSVTCVNAGTVRRRDVPRWGLAAPGKVRAQGAEVAHFLPPIFPGRMVGTWIFIHCHLYLFRDAHRVSVHMNYSIM